MSDDQKMSFSGRKPYLDEKARLMAVVCPSGMCHHCGTAPSTEFDHLSLRDWQPHKVNGHQRLRMYHREWVAICKALGHGRGVVGVGVVGSCGPCNQRRGGENTKLYSFMRKRRRARKGAGYTSHKMHTSPREIHRRIAEAVPF